MERLLKMAVSADGSKIHKISQWVASLKSSVSQLLFARGVLLYILSFFLGRAIVLTSISPFALAFLATAIIAKRQFAFPTFLFAVAGAITVSFSHASYILLSGLILMMLYKKWVHKVEKRIKWMAVATFVSVVVGRLIVQAVAGTVVIYDVATFVLEAALAGFLVMVFIQSYPFLKLKAPRLKLKVEEMVCIVILSTAVLTGFVGLSIYELSLEQVGAMYLVVMAAFIAGATVGSAVGVMIGLMLSLVSAFHLYQVSLLALAGLLGGLMKDVNRYAVTIGLFVSAFLIGMYNIEIIPLEQLLLQAVVAAALFMITPKSLISKIAKYVPGTEEEKEENEQYLQKVRDATASRVERFSEMFEALSHSFAYIDTDGKPSDPNSDVDEYLSRVTEKTCQTCLKKHSCWVNNFDRTYPVLQQTIMSIEENDTSNVNFNVGKLKNFCVKSDQVVDQMRYELSYYKANKRLKQQVKESRKFVSEQLNGVSEVMNNFAKEMVKEREEYFWHEQEIRRILEAHHFSLEHLELFSIEKGNVDIEMTVYFNDYRGEGEKLIAPLLSDLLEETVVVEDEQSVNERNGDRTFTFSSVKNYQLSSGVAHAAKKGNFLSGDSYLMLELGKSRFALAISDGMGNGERAYLESSETLKLLKQILQSGINEQVALQSINSILSLRTSDEIYATLDLAFIDLQEPHANFLKIGAMVSYIKRGSSVYPVESGNLPIGILEEFDVEPVREELKDGDLLIMVSDGILESMNFSENREAWLKRKIREIETEDPQAVADLVLEETIRSNHGHIIDDMTVLVTKVEKSRPKWASFSSVASV
ncbi:stage II sporulation protein E [Alkalibacillus haloalkaliphilus]|uniref:stage II sporulation protein E n=1 Tax=Alkalibacillus haloalkaliphilus TaxID=94136 RepID=UPI0002E07DB1|nr:stage II sporulation protein E [Alkalibacillus haloalkaliphilus]